MFAGLSKTRAYSKRHYIIVMAFAIVFACSVFVLEPHIRAYFTKDEVQTEQITNVSNETPDKLERSLPTRLVIPSINLDTTFVAPLGLLPDQTVGVPNSFTEVGWYSGGVSPGEVGPSVILGHVDSIKGPAVFYSLGQLKEGDDIEITRDDGTVVQFVVTKLERHPQTDFPTLAVYGPTDEPALRLVTCSGTFNKTAQRYSHNLVVYAKMK